MNTFATTLIVVAVLVFAARAIHDWSIRRQWDEQYHGIEQPAYSTLWKKAVERVTFWIHRNAPLVAIGLLLLFVAWFKFTGGAR